jgi:FtsH-binding integral membrane protein
LEKLMTATADTTQEDLRYVRELAESGAHAPLLGGRFMAWWGLLLTVAYMLQHFALRGGIGEGGAPFGLIWGGFGLLGGLGQFVLARSMAGKAGSGSAGNRASRPVWTAAACAILSMFTGLAIASGGEIGPTTFDGIVPVAFTAYACALIVTGALARSTITKAAGAGAVLMVGLFTALIYSPDRYLLAAAGVFATVLVPGLLLLRAERS